MITSPIMTGAQPTLIRGRLGRQRVSGSDHASISAGDPNR